MKIRPVGAELFHADGRTGMTKLTVAFRNVSRAPDNEIRATTFGYTELLFGRNSHRFPYKIHERSLLL